MKFRRPLFSRLFAALNPSRGAKAAQVAAPPEVAPRADSAGTERSPVAVSGESVDFDQLGRALLSGASLPSVQLPPSLAPATIPAAPTAPVVAAVPLSVPLTTTTANSIESLQASFRTESDPVKRAHLASELKARRGKALRLPVAKATEMAETVDALRESFRVESDPVTRGQLAAKILRSGKCASTRIG